MIDSEQLNFQYLKYEDTLINRDLTDSVTRRNNTELLAMQTDMYNEIKSRWPTMKVMWYRQYDAGADSLGTPAGEGKPITYTCPLTPNDHWSMIMYNAANSWPQTDQDLKWVSEYARFHGRYDGIPWFGPGYSSTSATLSPGAVLPTVDYQPDPEIWYQWGYRFVSTNFNKQCTTNNGRYFAYLDKLAGIAIYPPPGQPGFYNHEHYMYAYYCSLLGLPYLDTINGESCPES